MRPSVFVDTGAWVGLFAPSDQHHEEAVAEFDAVGEDGVRLVTTDLVLAETITRVRQVESVEAAILAWEALESGEIADLLDIARAQRDLARKWMKKHPKLVLSLTDCTSFVIMKQNGMLEALTFDDDFKKAGFIMRPRR